MCASSYSLLAACLLFLFLGPCFPGPQSVPGFSLLFSSLSISRSPTCFGLELFLDFLSFRLLGFPVLSPPLQCFAFDHGVSVPFYSKVSYGLDGSSSVLFGGVPPSPPVHRPSLGWPTRSISFLRLSLFGLFLEALLSEFSSFSPRSSRLALSFCRRAPGLLFASGSVFLPSLPSWSVGSPGSPHLGVPLCSGVLFPGLSLFCIFFGSAPFLPSSPAPPVSYGLVVGFSPRWAPPLRVYWLSSNIGPLWFCDLLSVSFLAYPSVVVVLFSSSVFVLSAVCLRRLCS